MSFTISDSVVGATFPPGSAASLVYVNTNIKYQILTSKILKDSSQVDRRPHADAVFRQPPLDVAQHASHGEDDPGLGGPGRLRGLLLSSSARHGAEISTESGSAAGHKRDPLINLT